MIKVITIETLEYAIKKLKKEILEELRKDGFALEKSSRDGGAA